MSGLRLPSWPEPVEWHLALPARDVHVVYEIRVGDDLVYVGMTGSPRKRLRTHSRRYGPHATFTLEYYRTRNEASVVEADRIRRLKPRDNVAVGSGLTGELVQR